MDFTRQRISVVVLGDIGRSPRMQYHALSMAQEGHEVTLVGYGGSSPLQKLVTHPSVRVNYMLSCPEFKKYLPTFLAYVFKVLWQSITLLLALSLSKLPQHILVQNPPSLPALGVCYFFCKLTQAKFIIDWHNYGHSILALSLREGHLLVKISKNFEFTFGRRSDYNLCVTEAMKKDLEEKHGIKALTFYDRPPEIFKEISVAEKHKICMKLGSMYDVFLRGCSNNDTVLTELNESGAVVLKKKRPGVVISSTSWTEDEDFSVLLNALEEYEASCAAGGNLPNLICAITGKGPLKEFYMNLIQRKQWKYVQVITPWLEAEDYPTFLACGDIGVCLHTSSSGLDLPMKVVDMFGCCMPVCAINFKCLSELVQHNENGYIFNDAQELAQQLITWFSGFPATQLPVHATFRKNLAQFTSDGWHANWRHWVLPLVEAADDKVQ